jgi:F-type H+-transporting ATPase subunit delta
MTNPIEAVHHATVLDDTERQVAAVYATALLDAAQKQHEDAGVLEELQGLVGEVFRRDPGFELFLGSAAIGRDRKTEVLNRAFGGLASEIFLNFLLVLNEHDRLNLLRGVLASYQKEYDKRGGRLHVEVRSAIPLAEDQLENLRQQLRTTFSREPVLDTRIDPDLLGGLVVRVADWVFDSSVRSRLDRIRNQLIERSSHEIQSGRDRFSS